MLSCLLKLLIFKQTGMLLIDARLKLIADTDSISSLNSIIQYSKNGTPEQKAKNNFHLQK